MSESGKVSAMHHLHGRIVTEICSRHSLQVYTNATFSLGDFDVL